ncbi:PQ loop repeat-domain-containing protein [Nemania serpens]|nr:PQ loop repeat-domain-containing protein [Nemania serpens]
MAPQGEIPVAANVLGTIGTVLWSIQLIPQAWTNWRTKETDGLPASMMFLWALCGVPFGVYAIIQNFNIPIQVQPHVFLFLCLINWGQTLLYTHKWPLWKVMAVTTGTAAIFAGVEAALILTLRPVYKAGNETPAIVIGALAATLLAVGLLPPYGEGWKRRGRIVGINFVFLATDALGAFFSLLSLVAQRTFDILGGVMYIVCILLEIGIFTSHLLWLVRTRQIRRAAKQDGKTFDDVMAEHEQQGRPSRFAERKSTRPWKKDRCDEEAGRSDHSDPTVMRRGSYQAEDDSGAYDDNTRKGAGKLRLHGSIEEARCQEQADHA